MTHSVNKRAQEFSSYQFMGGFLQGLTLTEDRTGYLMLTVSFGSGNYVAF